MAEYIEREAVLAKCGWYNTVNGKSVCAVRKDELAAIPAADVAPVVHGRVVTVTDRWKMMYQKCSECGETLEWRAYPNYCPNCGARMDGE